MDSSDAYVRGRFRCVGDLIPLSFSPAYALDVGCGTGKLAQIVMEKGYTYVGLEIKKKLLLKAGSSESKGIACFLQGDANSLPFRHAFKLVIATEIIEHLENPYNLLVEISKILLDNGYLIISTPNKASLEGFKGKISEFILGNRWTAWNSEHKHIFSSFEILYLLKTIFSTLKVCGYYFLPRIPSTEKFEEKWWFGSHLRLFRTRKKPLNRLGFQIIVLLKKAPTRHQGRIREIAEFEQTLKSS